MESWEQPGTAIPGPVASVLPLSQDQWPGDMEVGGPWMLSEGLDRLLWVAGASEKL